MAVFAFTSGAQAASCDLTGYVVSPDLLTYSLPGLGLSALPGVPAGCALVMPIKGVSADTISLFSASYSGALTDGSGARLTVAHNGVTDTTDLVGAPGGTFGELATGTVFAQGNMLQSTFTAEVTNAVLNDEFNLDTADYVLSSRANLFDLSIARTGIVTHLDGTADLLSWAGQPFGEGDGVSALGGIGSIVLGLSGRTSLDGGVTVQGGIGYLNQQSAGASIAGVIVSGEARYLSAPSAQPYRPFFEVGLHTAPALSTTFGLTYTTLTSTVVTSATAAGSYYGGYLEGGVLIAPGPADTVALSARLSSDLLSTDAFTQRGAGVFSVTQPAQSGLFASARTAVDYTRQFNPATALTLTGALGSTLGRTPVSSTIVGAGSLTTTAASEMFVQYGARLTYKAANAVDVSAFVFGTDGQLSGNHLQVGAGAKVSF